MLGGRFLALALAAVLRVYLGGVPSEPRPSQRNVITSG
jgi:hypothetical protein